MAVIIAPCWSTGKRPLSKVTFPGPRNLWNETVATLATGPNSAGGGSASPGALGSSTQTLIATGWFTVAVKLADTPTGGPVTFAPPCEKARTGGWLPMPSSLYGLMGYPLLRVNGIDCASPFDTMVQVIVLVPKSFGTLTTKTPHCRPTSKCVGCP